MTALPDSARFAPDDPEALVAASFCCPRCLSAPSSSELVEYPEMAVLARCASCQLDWEVGVDEQQLLRLELAPPKAIRLAGPLT